MRPFFQLVVKPAFEATDARCVVEIGALRGETTKQVLEQLGPGAEFHVIDPLPKFDPGEEERRFPGRFFFHRDLSLHALPRIPPADVALIDGDHNWYTVFNELKLLAATARQAGRPMPLLIMHDVRWPYGRRDLYYAPETIPPEYRHDHARLGIGRGHGTLLDEGGINSQLENAIEEGGPRNGVLTALEDFLLEHDEPVKTIVLPVYFGLAVVAETSRLDREPKLAAFFEGLESPAMQQRLVELADRVWLATMEAQQGRFAALRRQENRGAARYLELLKTALLDDHYVENEVRAHYLAMCAKQGREPEPRFLRQPESHLQPELQRLQAQRRTGRLSGDGNDARPYFPYTDMGRTRLDHLSACLDTIRAESVAGDLVECGTGRGGGAIFLRGYLDARGISGRAVWVADPFRAAPDAQGRHHPMTADLNAVREGFSRFGLLDQRVRFLQGRLPDALHDAPIETVALLRLGDGLRASPDDVLRALYDKVAIGGYVIVEHAGSPGGRESVEAFRERHGVAEPLERVDAGAVAWRKLEPFEAVAAPPAGHGRRAPVAPPPPADATDLTVVVVFHEMRREAERTLHSLSRSYQEGVETLDYEVLAVENGSSPDQKLGADFVRSFGPEFRYLDLGADARPSPVTALNHGIGNARGRNLALMIDGAHVLSPGVLRHGLAGLTTYAPAIVATQQWYVGPGQQSEAMKNGYDAEYEDRLFEAIGWPSRGYDLFDISSLVAALLVERDWFDPMYESNCLFVPRGLLEQAGAFDESFDAPGGGFANLDLYERMAATPDVNLVTILGEGSFHQVHGGSTTNVADDRERRRRISSYAEHYAELRARPFNVPDKRPYYVGRLGPTALRTKPRWRRGRQVLGNTGTDGPPTAPVLMRSELREEFTAAYWHSLEWQETTWCGEVVPRSMGDLVACRELVDRLLPAWVAIVGAEDPRVPSFWATICEASGAGRVLSIDGGTLNHGDARVRSVPGDPEGVDAVDTVRQLSEGGDALVVLSRAARARILARFELYAPLVPVGGYVVVEDTIVNGHPVWPGFGPGPMEAVRHLLLHDQRFEADRSFERYGPSFNPLGYLWRAAA